MAESHVSGGLSEHSIDLFQVSLQMRFSLNMLIEFWYQVPDFNELFHFPVFNGVTNLDSRPTANSPTIRRKGKIRYYHRDSL